MEKKSNNTILKETTPLPLDENKTVDQLLKEGKYVSAKEFIIAHSNDFPGAEFKVYIMQIKRLYKAVYVSDIAIRPLMIVGEKYHIWHGGRRTSDEITKEQFEDLLNAKPYPVSYYFVDLNHPVDGRITYESIDGNPPTVEEVLAKRETRISMEEQRKVAEQNRKDLFPTRMLKIEKDPLDIDENSIKAFEELTADTPTQILQAAVDKSQDTTVVEKPKRKRKPRVKKEEHVVEDNTPLEGQVSIEDISTPNMDDDMLPPLDEESI